MSCEDCEKIQNLTFNKNIDESPPIAYVRVDVGNVAIVGCEKHLKMLIEKLRKADGADRSAQKIRRKEDAELV